MIDLDKVSEGVDYLLVPHKQQEQRWAVEIIRGPYRGYRIIYANIVAKGASKTIDFDIYAIDTNGNNPQNDMFTAYANAILSDIMKTAAVNGDLRFEEIDNGTDADNQSVGGE